MSDNRRIAALYARKAAGYDERYGVGYYTHIHVGLYEPERYPALHRAGADLRPLGLERLKYLFWAGQEALTHKVSRALSESGARRVLDCGAGHGGTSIYLAENYGLSVTALTVAPSQAERISNNVRQAGLAGSIRVRVGDIFAHDFGRERFDAVLGLDSFSHIGRPRRLFSRLRGLLRPGGAVVVSDAFAAGGKTGFRRRFNDYFECDVTALDETVSGALGSGFKILDTEDLTARQLPFWRLKIAYGDLLLRSGLLGADERRGFAEARRFHRGIAAAFADGSMSYHALVMQKT